jgi:tRNA(adenine34) deaminase
MTIDSDMNFMRQALRTATEDGADPALSPIGCVIVMNGSIIAAERNHVAEHHDAVAHAEIEAIRKAGQQFENGELRGATLYTTLQPCGMCTMASIWSKVAYRLPRRATTFIRYAPSEHRMANSSSSSHQTRPRKQH